MKNLGLAILTFLVGAAFLGGGILLHVDYQKKSATFDETPQEIDVSTLVENGFGSNSHVKILNATLHDTYLHDGDNNVARILVWSDDDRSKHSILLRLEEPVPYSELAATVAQNNLIGMVESNGHKLIDSTEEVYIVESGGLGRYGVPVVDYNQKLSAQIYAGVIALGLIGLAMIVGSALLLFERNTAERKTGTGTI